MRDSWWFTYGQNLLVAIVVLGVLRYLARRTANRPSGPAEDQPLRFSALVLWVGIIDGFGFMALAAAFYAHPTGGPGAAAVFAAFSLLGIYLVVAYFFNRFVVRPGGLAYRTFLAGSGFAPWSSILEVTYSDAAKWFSLRLQNGKTVRVSALHNGLPALARAIRANAPSACKDWSVRVVLEDTENGKPLLLRHTHG